MELRTIRYDGLRPSILVLAEGTLYSLDRGVPGEVPERVANRLCTGREDFTAVEDDESDENSEDTPGETP